MTPAWIEPRTAYLHIPFCAHHCGYCDFAVSVGNDSLIELYLEALDVELSRLETPRTIESAFLGGGTPTYLTIPQLERLFTAFHKWFQLPRGAEFTIESNPDTLDEAKAKALAEFGITRASLGVQSFDPGSLQALDRRHSVSDIPKAVEAVKKHLDQLSLDLIFAAPGSTLSSWEADLSAALEFQPDHISTYGLTYEKGTPLWKQRERGQTKSLSEGDERAMYDMARSRLMDAGFEQYEVSNFGKPNARCRHNERYWANDAYFGFGVGAARYVGGVRELNLRNTKQYIKTVLAGESPTFQSEKLEPHAIALETFAVQLRRAEGIGFESFRVRTGYDLLDLIGECLPLLVKEDLIDVNGESLRLSSAGFPVADSIVEHLLSRAKS